MGDNYIQQPGAAGFGDVLPNNDYFEQLKNDLSGREEVVVQEGELVLPDGTRQPQWVKKLSPPDPEAALRPKGISLVIREVRGLLNKPALMGDLHNDERVRSLVASTCNAVVTELISNCSEYLNGENPEEKFGSVTDLMIGVRNGLYLQLTSTKAGGMRSFGEKTTGAQTVVKDEKANEGIIH